MLRELVYLSLLVMVFSETVVDGPVQLSESVQSPEKKETKACQCPTDAELRQIELYVEHNWAETEKIIAALKRFGHDPIEAESTDTLQPLWDRIISAANTCHLYLTRPVAWTAYYLGLSH